VFEKGKKNKEHYSTRRMPSTKTDERHLRNALDGMSAEVSAAVYAHNIAVSVFGSLPESDHKPH
jgi:hypothetical protein